MSDKHSNLNVIAVFLNVKCKSSGSRWEREGTVGRLDSSPSL